MANTYLMVRGYNSLNKIFERKIPTSLDGPTVVAMLQHLAAKHLTCDEVVSSSLPKDHPAYMSHLEVRRDHSGKPIETFTTLGNPFYVATLEAETDG